MTDEQETSGHSPPAVDQQVKSEHIPVRVLFVTTRTSDRNPLGDLEARPQFSVEIVDASTVFEHLGESKTDCVVTACTTSEMNGLDVLADVRREYPTLPFIVVSEGTVEGVAEEALSMGASDFVYLPQRDRAALLAHRIRTVVSRHSDERPTRPDKQAELRRVYHALESAHVGVALLNDQGKFEYVNQAYADLYGYNPTKMLGLHWRVLYPDDEVDRVANEILPSIDQGGDWSGKTTGLRADGTTFIEGHSLLKTSNGGLVCIVRDITEQEQRRELVGHYRSVVEDVFWKSEVGVFIIDSSNEVGWVNQTLKQYFGLKDISIEGADIADVVNRQLEQQIADPAALTGLVTPDEDETSTEKREVHVLSRADRDERYLEHRTQSIESGKYAGGRLELFYDITERKQKQQELNKSRERLEVATTAGSIGIWTWHLETDLVTVNSFLAETYGKDAKVSNSWIPIKDMIRSIHESDRDRVRQKLDRAIEETDEFEAEYGIQDRDGNTVWVVGRGEVEYDENGDPLRMNGALIDVTEQKQREVALQKTEQRLEAAMIVGSVGTWTFEVPENEVVGDAAMARLFGVDSEDMSDGVPLDRALESIHVEDRDRVAGVIKQALENGSEFETEYRVYSDDDTVRWVVARGKVEYDDDGNPVRFPGALADITERKQTQRRLEETAAKLERSNKRLSTLNQFNALIQDITQILIERSTRAEIERTVCKELARVELYTAASIGTVGPAEGEAMVRAASGYDGSGPQSQTALESESAMRAVQTGEIQVMDHLVETDSESTESEKRSQTRDPQTAMLVPIGHEQTSYGVLTLFTNRSEPFEFRQRAMIRRLGEIIGYAINAVETKQRLFADTAVKLKLTNRDPEFFLNAASAELDCVFELNDIVPDADGNYLYYISGTGAAPHAIQDWIASMDSVENVRLISGHPDTESVFEITINEASIVEMLSKQDAKVTAATVSQGSTRLTVRVEPQSDIRAVVETLKAHYSSVDLVAREEIDRSSPAKVRTAFTDQLTEKQRSALHAAYHAGFYSWPRDSSGEDVAESLGVSAPTYHEHLRSAHRTIISALLDEPAQGNP